MTSVGIRHWSVLNSLATTRDEFTNALFRGRSGLATGVPLPAQLGSYELSACVGVVTCKLPAPTSSTVGSDTRQLRLAQAGLSELVPELRAALAAWGPTRVGLVLGTSTGGILESEAAYRVLRTTNELPPGYSCHLGHAFDAAPTQLAREYGLLGPVYVISTACSSAGKALAAAKRLIDCDVCDAVLVGGVDTLCRLTLMGFSALGVLSPKPCEPFAEGTGGMNVSEGAAWLLLDREVGRLGLLGAGESADAHHIVTPHPEGLGAALAMERALRDAGVDASDIDYLNAHGTGTRANDDAERKAIAQVLGDVSFTSTKNLHGHQLGATGATEAVVCAEVLAQGECAKLPGAGRGTPQRPLRLAMSNSLAFGGSNVSLVFGPHEAPAPRRAPTGAFVRSLGFWCPGIPNAQALISATERRDDADEPAASLLPPRQRGRASLLTRMFAEVLEQLAPKEELRDLPLVYGSAFGPVQTTLGLLDQQQGGECSPLRFQNSVHNVAVGVLSIALGNRQHATAVAAGRNTVAAALLEASCWLESNPECDAVAMIVGDERPPEPLTVQRYSPMTAGILLTRSPSGALAHLSLPSASSNSSSDTLPTLDARLDLQQNPVGPAASLLWCLGNGLFGDYQATDDPRWPHVLSLRPSA